MKYSFLKMKIGHTRDKRSPQKANGDTCGQNYDLDHLVHKDGKKRNEYYDQIVPLRHSKARDGL